MDFEKILQNVARHVKLTHDEQQVFTSLLEQKIIPRKQFILREKQPCRYINFVVSGTLRAYFPDKDGKESTIMFAVQDWWITDMYCFVNRLPAMLNIEATEETVIFQLTKEALDNLYVEVPAFEKFFRILMQNAYTREQLRIIENLSLTAAERYQNFITKYPQIVKQVTQKQIASYLGITPEFLSSIRAKNKSVKNS